MEESTMQIKKIDRVACRCIDTGQTVEWYVKYLGMAPRHSAWMHAWPGVPA
jgi:hypothetical protein